MGQEVRHWFELAADLPSGDRAAFLEANCADEAVRSEVLSLLEYDGSAGSLAPAVVLPEALVREAIEAVLGQGMPPAPVQQVGPFELGRLLGTGGMGFVYEAERIDGHVRQRVAVKFAQVPPTAPAEERRDAYRRFLRERQMLASLRHPYIAGLIDAGTTADGTPYAVIEQVDGTPIDAYCDAGRLDQTQRIRLVLRLCEAVQCAHRNLIVHSDIKPDNILVTPDGMPKLIDFGVASVLNEEATLTGTRGFTPGYASPEQSRGDAATVATDVYGIGGVLYRLLAGVKPRELKNRPLKEVIRHICEEEVTRPSVIRPELKGDLENILMKALQRDPQRRYGSVPELADDLNRFLLRRPVRATPDSAIYRARRFARRHWVPLAAAAAVAGMLLAATGIALKQREAALLHAWETRRLADRLLFEVHDEIGGLVGGTRAREKLGAIAVQYLESLEQDYRKDPELAWELLSAYSRLGQSRGGGASSTGDTGSALISAAKTLELGAIVEASNPGAGRLDSLFQVYARLVPIFEEALRPQQRREAIERMLRLAPRLQPLREAQANKELARYYDATSQPGESAAAFSRSLLILRRLSGSRSKPDETDAELVTTLAGFGRSQALSGDFAGAVASLSEAIQRAERNLALAPQLARGVRQLYWSHIALGDVFGSPFRFNLGRVGEAVEHYRKAGLIAEKLLKADPGNDVAKLDYARSLSREGVALAAIRPASSRALLERAYALGLKTSPENYSGAVFRFDCLTSLVGPLARLGEFERAGAYAEAAADELKRLRQYGVRVNDRSLLRAQEIRLRANGRRREALAAAQRHLALLPRETNPTLGASFERVEVLERIRDYSAGADQAACAAATEALAGIWSELRAAHPRSTFVAGQADRARHRDRRDCVQPPRAAGRKRGRQATCRVFC